MRGTPPLEIPDEIDRFLGMPNPAVIACVRPDGFPSSVATWYDWRDGEILVNMHAERKRLGWMRLNPKVSLTVLDESWYRHVSLTGLIVRIEDDVDMVEMDRLSRRYTGQPFVRRKEKRVNAWIRPRGIHVWKDGGRFTAGSR